jgi:hypothetical protein
VAVYSLEVVFRTEVFCKLAFHERLESESYVLAEINVRKSRPSVKLKARLVTYMLPLQFLRYSSRYEYKIITEKYLAVALPNYIN